MPRILILGATGYIGSTLAKSLLRSGEHKVYGLARTPAKAAQLKQLEIVPIIGTVEDSAEYLAFIHSEGIAIVVDAAGANNGSTKILSDLRVVAAERLAMAKTAGIACPRLGFIYVSGTWVHGSSNSGVSDLDPVGVRHAKTQPPALVAWRPQVEQAVLASTEIMDVAVIRPALVYGREHAIWTSIFSPIHEAAKAGAESATIATRPDSWLGLVHIDDVALGLHAAINRLPGIASTGVHPVFDLVTSRERMSDIVDGAAVAFAFGGKLVYSDPKDNLFAEALCTSFNGSSARAKQILGWKPKRFGMVARIDVYGNAWAAHQE